MKEEKNNSLTNENLENDSEQKINFEALAIYKAINDENPNTEIKNVSIYPENTLQKGDLQYPHYTGTVYSVARIENKNGKENEVLDLYKSMYDPETQEFKPVKIAIQDENGLRLTEEYKVLLENQYRAELYPMITPIIKDEMATVLSIPENMLDVIKPEELNLELQYFDPKEIIEKYQLQMKEEDKLDELDFSKNIKEDENKDLEKIAKQKGLNTSSLQAMTKINPKEIVAEGRSFEGEMGIEDEYRTIYATVMNGTFAFYGIKKDTGEAELIQNCSPTTQGERNIPIMDETGNIEKKQVRAIFKVDRTKAFALNIEPGSGTMNVSYCARGASENEYFGKQIGTDKQATATGSVQHFMGVEVMGQTDNRRETVEEAYDQLEETEKTNRTLIDENQSNDEIYSYFDINEPIKMHDGTETTIAQEAQKSEEYKDNIEGYITDLEDSNGKCLSEKIESMREKIFEEEDRDIGEELEKRRLEELRRAEQYKAIEEANNYQN